MSLCSLKNGWKAQSTGGVHRCVCRTTISDLFWALDLCRGDMCDLSYTGGELDSVLTDEQHVLNNPFDQTIIQLGRYQNEMCSKLKDLMEAKLCSVKKQIALSGADVKRLHTQFANNYALTQSASSRRSS